MEKQTKTRRQTAAIRARAWRCQKIAEGYEREMQRKVKTKAKDLREIGEAKGETHEGGVAEIAGGEMAEQRGDGEEEEGQEERVGADLAHAEFALGGDDEDGDAEVAEGVAVEEKG